MKSKTQFTEKIHRSRNPFRGGGKAAAVLLCGVLLLGGCGRKESEPGQDASAGAKAAAQSGSEPEQDAEEKTAQEQAAMDSAGTDADNSAGEDLTASPDAQGTQEQGAVVIEIGPDKRIWGEGSLVCTLRDFKLCDSPADVSVEEDELMTVDAESYMEMPDGSRSKFLLVQAEINNLDYPGDNEDGTLNVSMFTIVPAQSGQTQGWECSYPVYVPDGGKGETDFYHVETQMGQTRTIVLGYYVPVKDEAELRSRCRVGLYGNHDDEYMYEIP